MRTGGILALDLGAVVGWAYVFPGDPTPLWNNMRVAAKDSDIPEVGLLFVRFLNDLISRFEASWAIWEPPFQTKSVQANQRLFGLHMAAHIVCRHRRVSVPPDDKMHMAKAMKFIHGPGRLPAGQKKALTRQVIEQRYGCSPIHCDDESDALAVLFYGEALISPDVSRKRGGAPLLPPEVKTSRAPRKRRQEDLLSV